MMGVTELNPVILPPAALAALKAAQRITVNDDDALLWGELRAAFAACEAFTRQTLINREFEEILVVQRDWQPLRHRPVTAITSVTALSAQGQEFALAVDGYALDIHADGEGRVQVKRPGSASRVKITYAAGMLEGWSDLPEPLRQGILMQAAAGFLNRNADQPVSGNAQIAALWHPWRQIRLG